jgi:hypothetical protein
MSARRTILIALADDLAERPVVAVGMAIGELLDAEVSALHVGESAPLLARRVCDEMQLPLSIRSGRVVPVLRTEIDAEGVVATVLGARSRPGGRRPSGRTTFRLMASATKALVIVPPDLAPSWRLRRILLPIEGVLSTLGKLIISRASGLGIDTTILHVQEETSIPLFEDQPQHEGEAWAEEFVARHDGLDRAEVTVRVGVPSVEIARFAGSEHPDLVVLGWREDLSARGLSSGRAEVVRSSMGQLQLPIMLVPEPAPRRRRRSWPSWDVSPGSPDLMPDASSEAVPDVPPGSPPSGDRRKRPALKEPRGSV